MAGQVMMGELEPGGTPVPLKVNTSGQLITTATGGGGGAPTGDPVPTDATYLGAQARSSDKTAETADNLVGLVSDLYGKLAVAGYVWADNAIRVEEINPAAERDVPDKPVDVTNEAAGTYYAYFDMQTSQHLGLQLVMDPGAASDITVTVEGTMQDDGTAPASCTYDDVSSLWGAANWVVNSATPATFSLTDPEGEAGNFRYIRLKRVHTGADTDITVFSRQWVKGG